MEYDRTETAEASTDEHNVYITGHGMSGDEMMVNTTRRTQYTAERGSRPISYNNMTEDSFYISNAITDQASGDSIRLYSYMDKTSYLKSGSLTLNKRLAGQTDCTFTLICTAADWMPFKGQRVKIVMDSTEQLIGYVYSMRKVQPDVSLPYIFIDVQCNNLTQAAKRRTVRVNYDLGTSSGDIANEMLTEYLIQDGVRYGEVTTGVLIDDDWIDDCLSIADIMDHIAQISGYMWYVDDKADFYFHKNSAIVDSDYNLEDGEAFRDFFNLQLTETCENYANKVFLTGGTDGSGNPIIISTQNDTEMNDQQALDGGTGVFGQVIKDASIEEAIYVEAEVGTTTTTIYMDGHGQSDGWVVFNLTCGQYGIIDDASHSSYFTLKSPITGQTDGDTIVIFYTANTVIQNALEKRAQTPLTITFDSMTQDWVVGTRLHVDLALFDVLDSYFLIEQVTFTDPQIEGQDLKVSITASSRNGSAFNTQPNGDFRSYFLSIY
jgi:hypothetical protein